MQRKNGFMYKFYVVSEALSPTLAWGFLGTDEQLRVRCIHFKVREYTFLYILTSRYTIGLLRARSLMYACKLCNHCFRIL